MSVPSPPNSPLSRLARLVEDFEPRRDALSFGGTVREVGAGYARVAGIEANVGDILFNDSDARLRAEVVQIDKNEALVAPFGATLLLGARMYRRGPPSIAPTTNWIGRVINAFGEPIDDLGHLPSGRKSIAVRGEPPAALARRLVSSGLSTGVRVIDLFAPLCIGQRMGVFAGSGVGKSTLLSMFAKSDRFDLTVVGLIGERGREVREFIDQFGAFGRSGLIVVVATGDESALQRRLAAQTTMAVAEYFRDLGRSVLVILDSVTRFALACREVAIAAGEPPVSRGFPPSVFTDLPRLLERAGPGPERAGDITAVFSVLVDGDDHNDPIADAVRGILDGHIVLDRAVAMQGRYPAVNIPASISRLAHIALPSERLTLANRFRAMIARYEESRDLRAMGGYVAGVDADLDTAVAIVPLLYANLAQSGDDPPSVDAFRDVTEALKRQTAPSS